MWGQPPRLSVERSSTPSPQKPAKANALDQVGRIDEVAVCLPSALSGRILSRRTARTPPAGGELRRDDGWRAAEACPERGVADRIGLGRARRRNTSGKRRG